MSGAARLALLTRREREMLRAICVGEPRREAAAKRGVGIRTVETHLHEAYRKLGVSGKGAAGRACYRLGMGDGAVMMLRRGRA